MFEFLESLNHKFAILTGLAVSISLLVPKVRQGIIGFYRGARMFFTAPAILDEMARDLKYVKGQVSLNGGSSLKDATVRLEMAFARQDSFRRHDFWTKGRPAMEMDGKGHVTLVSEALCQLLQVSAPEELYRRSWLRFMHSSQVDGFLEAFVETASNNSAFRYEATLHDSARRDIGQWEFRANPIEPEVAGAQLYSGHWVMVE